MHEIQKLRIKDPHQLFDSAIPIAGTLAQLYLHNQDISETEFPSLRFHDSVFFLGHDDAHTQRLPAMLAALVNMATGKVVTVHCTWLDGITAQVAAVRRPKRPMGICPGTAVPFGVPRETLVVGEEIETVLSLKSACPGLPMAAALSCSQLATVVLPTTIKRLWIARDQDLPGVHATSILRERVNGLGIDVRVITPLQKNFGADLAHLGRPAFEERARGLLADELAGLPGS